MSYGKEDIEHVRFADWLRYKNIPFFHIPNQRKCTPQYGQKLKRMGVKPGVYDIFIAVASGNFHGLFIEMKSSRGRLSKEQLAFACEFQEHGYKCEIAYSFEEAERKTLEYLSLDNIIQDNQLPRSTCQSK